MNHILILVLEFMIILIGVVLLVRYNEHKK